MPSAVSWAFSFAKVLCCVLGGLVAVSRGRGDNLKGLCSSLHSGQETHSCISRLWYLVSRYQGPWCRQAPASKTQRLGCRVKC